MMEGSLAVACLHILAVCVKMKSMVVIQILVGMRVPVQRQMMEDYLAIAYMDTVVHSVKVNLISVSQVHARMEEGASMKTEYMCVCADQDIQDPDVIHHLMFAPMMKHIVERLETV
jgi:hypothetical protein